MILRQPILLATAILATVLSSTAAPSGMLAGAFVMDMARDAAGAVWAGTEDGGVLRGDPDAGTWEAFKVPGVDGENHAYVCEKTQSPNIVIRRCMFDLTQRREKVARRVPVPYHASMRIQPHSQLGGSNLTTRNREF